MGGGLVDVSWYAWMSWFYSGNNCNLSSGLEYIGQVDLCVFVWVDALVFTVGSPVICPVGLSTLGRQISLCLYGWMLWFLHWKHLQSVQWN